MKKIKLEILFIVGIILGAFTFSLGLLTLCLPDAFESALAIVIICLSIAGGMILFPIFEVFLLCLLIGVLMLAIPKIASAIVLMAIGVIVTVSTLIAMKKTKASKYIA